MKGKYVIIIVLILLLAAAVYAMLRLEESIREERVVTVLLEDETRPLLPVLQEEEILKKSRSAQVIFYAGDTYFYIEKTVIRNGERVRIPDTVFIKGVNLGVAMPGKFPSQFSLSFEEYLEWFKSIGEMNANVIRTYTILPPEFYDALLYYNVRNEKRILYLMQGVWAVEPPDENYRNTEYTRSFQREIADVIDVLNGNGFLRPARGKADGIYAADVSDYVIGILLGREWEPHAVMYTNDLKSVDHYQGRFISAPHVNPMEAWLAEMMDFTIHYETQIYGKQRPVSFVNWLPLDPMHHNTEYIENEKVREFDNDLESIDFTKFHATEHFKAGIYAAYHAYPYYPDYIYLKEEYSNAVNDQGDKDNYFGYLLDLKNHTRGMPLIIAEYGLPSSRGNSHYNPYGFHQGGLNEQEQADLSVTLTKDIHDTGCGGAIFFEWVDEWFKFNWLVMDFEQPAERRKEWHNMENPEQNFGIVSVESDGITTDGVTGDWEEQPEEGETDALFGADPSYFNALLNLPNFNFEENNLFIAIDTYDDTRGDHRLPLSDKYYDEGYEFIVEFYNPDSARILVDEWYSVFTDIYNDSIPVYASRENSNGLFVEQILLVNRGRRTLLGDTIMPVYHNRSGLLHGNSSEPETSNASWFWNPETGKLELRLTWHLLNVSDPSSLAVLDDKAETNRVDYSITERFKIRIFITDKQNRIVRDYPNDDYLTYIWEQWEIPEYRTRLKPIYFSFQELFANMEPEPVIRKSPIPSDSFRIVPLSGSNKGAVSISFDDADYAQFEYALPLLEKYDLKAGFGAIGEWLADVPAPFAESGGFQIKKMGIEQFQILSERGHEISFHGFYHKPYNSSLGYAALLDSITMGKRLLQSILPEQVITIHYPYSFSRSPIDRAADNAGFHFGRTGGNAINELNNLSYLNLQSIAVLNDTTPAPKDLEQLLEEARNGWVILVYHHLFPSGAKEYSVYRDHNVTNTYALTPEEFEHHIRLIRNSGYWVAPIAEIGKYLKEREHAKIDFLRHQNLIFLTLHVDLDSQVYNQPLCVEMTTDARFIKVRNSAADGVYEVRNNKVLLRIYPNTEIIIEKVFS